MKPLVSKTMKWLGENFEAVIAFLVAAVTALAGYFDLRSEVKALRKQSDQTDKTVDDHVISPALHRTPDFEKTQSDIKAELVRMNGKIDRVIELLPRRP